jgi:probable F420-dependent oxidoreductase
MGWGLSLEMPGVPITGHAEVLRAAEQAGYTDAWPGEVSGYDAFTPLTVAAMTTERMRLGTGVIGVFTRGPGIIAQHAATLQNLSGGRFWLGIGSSSNVIVERWNHTTFEKPLTRVREAVEYLRPALAGEKAPGGFKLEQPPEQPVPIVIGALREKMLQTAGELGDGAFLNFLPLASVDKVVAEVRKGEQAAGKEAGSVETFCRFFCIQGEREQAMGLARFMFCAYATVPVYEKFFRWLGYGEAIDPMVDAWRGGDRQKALELAPTDLIEDVFVLGDAAEQRARLEAYVEKGVNTPVLLIVPASGMPGGGYGELVESLAPDGGRG